MTRQEVRPVGKIAYDVCAIVVCIVFLVPVLWAIFSAFQPPSNLFTFPPNFERYCQMLCTRLWRILLGY